MSFFGSIRLCYSRLIVPRVFIIFLKSEDIFFVPFRAVDPDPAFQVNPDTDTDPDPGF